MGGRGMAAWLIRQIAPCVNPRIRCLSRSLHNSHVRFFATATEDVEFLKAENRQLKERVQTLEERIESIFKCMAIEEEIEELEEAPTETEKLEIQVLQQELAAEA